jgi:hypothetical protein
MNNMRNRYLIYYAILISNLFFSSIYSQNVETIDPQKSNCRYFGLLELNYSKGIGEIKLESSSNTTHGRNLDNIVGARFINGIQINKSLSLGFGVGIESSNYIKKILLFPVSLDARIFFLKNKNFKPFLNINAGYPFGSGQIGPTKISGGVHINPSIGIKKSISEKLGLHLSIGYLIKNRHLKTDVVTIPDPGAPIYQKGVEYNSIYQYITVNAGLSF